MTISAISLFGVAFSGFLSYQDVFGRAATSCPAPGAPGTVFGYPACVYGFFMYLNPRTAPTRRTARFSASPAW